MKSVFYAGAALMLAAGIYGFVDYKKSNRNQEFKSMFDETEAVQPAATGNDPVDVKEKTVPVKSQDEVVTKKTGAGKVNLKEKKAVEDVSMEKERVLSPKLFSRAPLKDVPKIRDSEIREKGSKSEKSQ